MPVDIEQAGVCPKRSAFIDQLLSRKYGRSLTAPVEPMTATRSLTEDEVRAANKRSMRCTEDWA
jgi:hypothetical protein